MIKQLDRATRASGEHTVTHGQKQTADEIGLDFLLTGESFICHLFLFLFIFSSISAFYVSLTIIFLSLCFQCERDRWGKKKKKLRQGNIIEYVEGRDDAIKQLFLFATCPRTEKVSSPERFYIFTYSVPSFFKWILHSLQWLTQYIDINVK